jgi:thiamine pyrophosphokinase
MRALILCNGEPPSAELLAHHLASTDLVICADGALDWARAAGARIDAVIGDMDSVAEATTDAEVLNAGPHEAQNNTDAEKAVLCAIDRGAEQIVLLGATGRRLDHTLGNVWLAHKYAYQAQIVVIDEFSELLVVRGLTVLCTRVGATVSLLALEPGTVVRTTGLQWPLDGPLEPGTRGLSNRACGDIVEIDVASGAVAVIIVRGEVWTSGGAHPRPGTSVPGA